MSEAKSMSKEQIVELIQLLSAMEAWSFSGKSEHAMPDYLYDKLSNAMDVLTKEVLK